MKMLNTKINEFAIDQELTQTASYFAIVDNAIKTGDTNKIYKISTQQCEAAPTPFSLGSWTTIPLSPQGDNMVDLYNSFLTVDLKIPAITGTTSKDPFPNFSGTDAASAPNLFNLPGLWVGFKDSANIVGQYQLLANGQTFYTQSFAIEESYITSLASTDAVKHVDTYSKATHKDVWRGKDTARSGIVINYSNKSSTNNIISLKIDFRRFLPLAAIKYIPDFVGNLEMRIKFSLDGLVVAPLGPEFIAKNNPLTLHKIVMASGSEAGITNKFVPYKCLENGDTVYGITGATYASNTLTLTAGLVGATISATPEIVRCESHLACFGLDQNIYNQLAAQYTQRALSFPIQTMSFHQMNGNFGNANGDYTPSLTAVPRFVDSIFILFPLTSDYHTCFDNVLAERYQIKMGGYGTFPDVQYESWSPEFLEVAANVFNVNNDLTGFSKDVVKSLTNDKVNTTGFYSNDTSNFVLAIPTSTDNTFQQGQTSNTTINYQLHITLDDNSPFKAKATCCPMLCFLKDSVLAIQLRGNGAPPIVTLDEYDITSPAQ